MSKYVLLRGDGGSLKLKPAASKADGKSARTLAPRCTIGNGRRRAIELPVLYGGEKDDLESLNGQWWVLVTVRVSFGWLRCTIKPGEGRVACPVEFTAPLVEFLVRSESGLDSFSKGGEQTGNKHK